MTSDTSFTTVSQNKPNFFKILVVGETSVGKTSIIKRLCHDEFTSDCPSTIGADFFSKKIELDSGRFHLQFWDVSGDEAFNSMCKFYARNTDACIIVYDQTNLKSYEKIYSWKSLISNYIRENGSGGTIPFYIIQNKIDLPGACELADIQDQKKVRKTLVNEGGFSGVVQTSARKAIGMGKLMHLLSNQFLYEKIQSLDNDSEQLSKGKAISSKVRRKGASGCNC